MNRLSVDPQEDPLRQLTESLYIEPERWMGWSVDRMFEQLSPGQVVAVEGVTDANWEPWRAFLRDFEVASRRRASDQRAVMLVFVRGVPRRRLQMAGAALTVNLWSGVLGELDTLTYVDRRLKSNGRRSRCHKLLVRQIAALALWDLELADFLTDRPDAELFDFKTVLLAARESLAARRGAMSPEWEAGGLDEFDGVDLLHPFILVHSGDPKDELKRRVWTAQAAELLPLVEVRRRELAKALERHVPCPFWIDGKRLIRSLDELEIGSLAYVTQIQGVRGELRERAEWLAGCRNTLAHLGLVTASDALDFRLHG